MLIVRNPCPSEYLDMGFTIKEHNGQKVLYDEFDQVALMYLDSPDAQALAEELLLETFDHEGLAL